MRIGQNPAKVKGLPAYTPARVGIASLTYVPGLEGYFTQALDVIRVHLASLRASLSEPCNLCVFDNGSCAEVVAFLEEQWRAGLIDWLCLSNHNIGKNGALNWLFAALPNEFIAYADSDVFYRPGWLEASLQLFEAYDRAGMVSAQPVFFDFLRGQGQTVKSLQASGFQVESVLPRPEVLQEYCDGINATPEQRQQFQQQRLQVARGPAGARAVTTATDMQFMMRKTVAAQVLPFPIAGALTGKDAIEVPRRIEAQGYWILSTEEPLVWHMGNTLDARPLPEVARLVEQAGTDLPPQTAKARKPAAGAPVPSPLKSTLQGWLRRSPALRRLAERLYGGLFKLLYEES